MIRGLKADMFRTSPLFTSALFVAATACTTVEEAPATSNICLQTAIEAQTGESCEMPVASADSIRSFTFKLRDAGGQVGPALRAAVPESNTQLAQHRDLWDGMRNGFVSADNELLLQWIPSYNDRLDAAKALSAARSLRSAGDHYDDFANIASALEVLRTDLGNMEVSAEMGYSDAADSCVEEKTTTANARLVTMSLGSQLYQDAVPQIDELPVTITSHCGELQLQIASFAVLTPFVTTSIEAYLRDNLMHSMFSAAVETNLECARLPAGNVKKQCAAVKTHMMADLQLLQTSLASFSSDLSVDTRFEVLDEEQIETSTNDIRDANGYVVRGATVEISTSL